MSSGLAVKAAIEKKLKTARSDRAKRNSRRPGFQARQKAKARRAKNKASKKLRKARKNLKAANNQNRSKASRRKSLAKAKKNLREAKKQLAEKKKKQGKPPTDAEQKENDKLQDDIDGLEDDIKEAEEKLADPPKKKTPKVDPCSLPCDCNIPCEPPGWCICWREPKDDGGRHDDGEGHPKAPDGATAPGKKKEDGEGGEEGGEEGGGGKGAGGHGPSGGTTPSGSFPEGTFTFAGGKVDEEDEKDEDEKKEDERGGTPGGKTTSVTRPGGALPKQPVRKTVAKCGTLRKEDFQKMVLKWFPKTGAAFRKRKGSRTKLLELRRSESIALNKEITRAYQVMYSLKPKAFKWALAGHTVSGSAGKFLATAELAESSLFTPAPGFPGSRGPASQFLTRGNRAIFRDIFWMHIAYLFCGKKQMRALWNAGDISREVFLAWSLIDVGLVRGHDDIIWNGALGLARHEQVGVLQRVIDSSKTNQLLMRGAGLVAKDTIPGRDTPFDVLEGNFDNPDARMEWVEETLWPAFRSYESEFGVSKLVPVPPDIQADVALFPSTPK